LDIIIATVEASRQTSSGRHKMTFKFDLTDHGLTSIEMFTMGDILAKSVSSKLGTRSVSTVVVGKTSSLTINLTT